VRTAATILPAALNHHPPFFHAVDSHASPFTSTLTPQIDAFLSHWSDLSLTPDLHESEHCSEANEHEENPQHHCQRRVETDTFEKKSDAEQNDSLSSFHQPALSVEAE
jgi:hypothetical protein